MSTIAAPTRELLCRVCGDEFSVAVSRGRYPSSCPRCRTKPVRLPRGTELTMFALATAGDGTQPKTLAYMTKRDIGDVLDDLAVLQAAGLAQVWASAPTRAGRQAARAARATRRAGHHG